jgi:hypothetical protein
MRWWRRLRGGHWEHWILEDENGIERWEWVKVEECFYVNQNRPSDALQDEPPLGCEDYHHA